MYSPERKKQDPVSKGKSLEWDLKIWLKARSDRDKRHTAGESPIKFYDICFGKSRRVSFDLKSFFNSVLIIRLFSIEVAN